MNRPGATVDTSIFVWTRRCGDRRRGAVGDRPPDHGLDGAVGRAPHAHLAVWLGCWLWNHTLVDQGLHLGATRIERRTGSGPRDLCRATAMSKPLPQMIQCWLDSHHGLSTVITDHSRLTVVGDQSSRWTRTGTSPSTLTKAWLEVSLGQRSVPVRGRRGVRDWTRRASRSVRSATMASSIIVYDQWAAEGAAHAAYEKPHHRIPPPR
jgi:hypothetical protein